MLLKVAWRNIWRSRSRSLVVIGSIALGIWAIIFGTGFTNGFLVGYSANMIEHDISNIQIHSPEFKTDFDIHYFIPEGKEKVEEMSSWDGVVGVSARSISNGMISSPQKAMGVQIRGIDPASEAIVTELDSMIIEGDYFKSEVRNPIVIGSKLAESLKVKLRSKIVLTFNDANGDVTAGAFRIVGILHSSSISINELFAFVEQEDLTKLLGIGDEVHEIAILTAPHYEENLIVAKYQELYPQDKIETWREIAPELVFMSEMYESMLYVLMGIIMVALVFGIVNTMLMAVLERTKELGVLMAIGMNKLRVFFMILIETIYLSLVGAPIGLLLAFLTMYYYSNTGVDLSNYSQGLEAFGYSSILYPYIENKVYLIVSIGVVFTAFVGAIYPALKAINLKPVEAIHSI